MQPVVVIVAGTGLPHQVSTRLLAPLAESIGADHLISLPHLGLRHLDTTCRNTAAKLSSLHRPGQPLHIVGWSQGVLPAVFYAGDKPEVSVVSLGGPFGRIQGLWWLLSHLVPGVHDMSRGCSFADALRTGLPGLDGRLYSVYSTHDEVVDWRSSRLDGFPNLCLSAGGQEGKMQLGSGLHTQTYPIGRISHPGLVTNRQVHTIVANTLADLSQANVAA